MKRLVLLAALLVSLPSTAIAHHLPVTAAVTDADAFAVAVSEYAAQRQAIIDAFGLFSMAQSAGEKLTALNDVETAVTVGLEHLDSLDVRDCFAVWFEAAVGEFESAADGVAEYRADGAFSQDTITRNTNYAHIANNPTFQEMLDCDGEALA